MKRVKFSTNLWIKVFVVVVVVKLVIQIPLLAVDHLCEIVGT